VRTRVLAHPIVVRLLAVVLAVAGAGVAGRAPQALRAWTDTAAEVARTGPRAQVEKAAPNRKLPTDAAPAPTAVAYTDAIAPPATHAGAWPAARDLRQLLALKQSRLI
jgi:hypothetical protein